MKIIVLGAGLVGNVIARDLAEDSENHVSIVDINQDTLDILKSNFDLNCICADLSNPTIIKDIVKDYDLVIGALPGFMGFQALKTVIETGKNIVDISFFEEDPFNLDELAKEKGVTAVIDCGIAPGLSSIILGYVDSILDETFSFLCFVGGLPVEREWPFEYKAPFSPIDVLEEYTRLARYIVDSEIVIKPALSEPELIDFPEVGTLEAFNTDGLRSLLRTMNIPFMKEKTLRYPGHIEIMKIFRETGFFDKEVMNINGKEIIPLEITSKLLFDKWKLNEGDEDLTVLRIIIEGMKDGKKVRYSYDMVDHYDREKSITSMARTTGYTCTAVAKQIAQGKFTRKGICPPEYIGQNENVYDAIIEELFKRNVILKESFEELD
ncbi:MAG: saccharopine dehydrogenase C-terminal domain-containing protein [Candidatus Heimdallarchaeota archaeon]